MVTSCALTELDGSFDVGTLAEMLAGGHEDNVQQEQRVRRVWLHEMQLHRRSIENGVIEACILITKKRKRVHGQCKYVCVSHIHKR